MRAALANPIYRRLYLAQIIALLGSGLATVALGLLAYDLAGAGATRVLGTALAVKMVAYVTLAPVMEALVARLPRKRVLIGADLVRMAVAACLPLVTEAWQIYPLIFVLQAASATFTPLFQSVLPDVLPEEDAYTGALSLSRLAQDMEAIVSPMLAAALLLVVSTGALFDGTAVGFAASAALVASCALPGRRAAVAGEGEDGGRGPAAFARRARRGMALLAGRPALRPILALNMVPAAGGGYVIVQTVVIAQSRLGLGEQAVAWLLAAAGAGSMTGALLLPIALRRAPERAVMLSGAVLVTAATALIGPALALTGAPAVAAVAALWAAIGVGWSAAETPVGRILRRHAPAADLPAAFAAQFSLSHACWLVSYLVVGWVGAVSAPFAAVVMAALAGAGTLAAAALWRAAGESAAAPGTPADA